MTSPLNYYRYYRQLDGLDGFAHFRASHVKAAKALSEAKRLHAKIYLYREYVTPADIGEDESMHIQADPYQEHANYFIVRDHKHPEKRVVATARQITAHPKRGHSSFPTIKELELYPDMKGAILALDPSKCVEISGLAKERGVNQAAALTLYRALWHHSLRRGHHVWLMACDARVFVRLQFLFGDAFVRIGDNAYYMGSEVVPAMLEVHRSIDPLIADSKSFNPLKRRMKRILVQFFMSGLSVKFQQLQSNSVVPSRELARAVQAKKI